MNFEMTHAQPIGEKYEPKKSYLNIDLILNRGCEKYRSKNGRSI